MDTRITIKAKSSRKGESEYKIISIRLKDTLLDRLDSLSSQTNRSRNVIINLLLESAVDMVVIK